MIPSYLDRTDLAVTIHRAAHPPRVTVAGDVDVSTAPDVRSALTEAASTAAGPIEVDLSGVTFFSTAGVSALNTVGPRLHLVAASPAVERVLALLTRGGVRLPLAATPHR